MSIDIRVNQQIGNYRLTRLLGKGGYAAVYLGTHLILNKEAAIKVLLMALTPADREAFLAEARAMARFHHPHIVPVFEAGEEQGVLYLVMEYAPNGSLLDRHPPGTQLTLENILPYVYQVADALDYAHSQRLIHRDIKPGNLLIGEQGQVLLSDFGVAITQSTMTNPQQQVAGTVAYMAPEQIEGRAQPASDQYALAVVVYEWLMGEWPFQGTISELVSHHLYMPPPSLRAKLPDLPIAVERVIHKALSKNPAARFSSVGEFAQALDQAVTLRPIGKPNVTRQFPRVTPFILSPEEAGLPPEPPPPSEAPASSPGTTLVSYTGHQGLVTALVWSSDGKKIASGSWDQTVHIWDSATGEPICIYQEHQAGVTAISWSPNGRYLASGDRDGTIHLWDAKTGKLYFPYRGHNAAITALAWSHDGKKVASASDDQVVDIWVPGERRRILSYRGHHAVLEMLLWSGDNRRLTSVGRDASIQIWDVHSGGNTLFSRSHDAPRRSVSWSSGGKYRAAGTMEGRVLVTEAISQQMVLAYSEHRGAVIVVAWSPNCAMIASGGEDQRVQVWLAPKKK
jgi:serine/threonine protein kinase